LEGFHICVFIQSDGFKKNCTNIDKILKYLKSFSTPFYFWKAVDILKLYLQVSFNFADTVSLACKMEQTLFYFIFFFLFWCLYEY